MQATTTASGAHCATKRDSNAGTRARNCCVRFQPVRQPSIVSDVIEFERAARGGNGVENGQPADAGIEHQNALGAVNHLGNRP